jgi:hypothetical protein
MRSVILSLALVMVPITVTPAAAQGPGQGQPLVDRLQDMLMQVDQLNRRRGPDEFQASIAHQIQMIQDRFNDIRSGGMQRRQALEAIDEGLYNILQYNYNGSNAAPPWLSYRVDETVSEMRGLIANRRGGWRGPPPRGGYQPIPVLVRRPGWDAPPPPVQAAPPPAPVTPPPGQWQGQGQQLVDRLQEMLMQVDQLNRRRRPDEFQASIAHQIQMIQDRFNDIRMGRMQRRQALEAIDEGLYNILQYNYNGSNAAPPWLSYRIDETVSEMRGLIANRRGGWRGSPARGGYQPIPVLVRRPGWDAPPPPAPVVPPPPPAPVVPPPPPAPVVPPPPPAPVVPPPAPATR